MGKMRFAQSSCLAVLLAQIATTQIASAQPAPEPAPAPVTRPAPPPLKLETPDSSLKLGVLFQPQYEMAGSATLSGVSHNIFVRRVRILASATLFKNVEFFFDTDYPDLFKAPQDTG